MTATVTESIPEIVHELNIVEEEREESKEIEEVMQIEEALSEV